MTRQEIEKRCREEMQQTIPNKEALWTRIEGSLPAQKPSVQPETGKRKPRISVIYRVTAAAACFLFVAAGLTLWGSMHGIQKSDTANEMAVPQQNGNRQKNADAVQTPEAFDGLTGAEQAAAENEAACESCESYDPGTVNAITPELSLEEQPDDEVSGERGRPALYYGKLPLPEETPIASSVDRSLLSYDEEAFDQTNTLSQAEVIAEVHVTDGWQYTQTGVINYVVNVVQCYGGDLYSKELIVESRSPYLLEVGHNYLLPLYQTEEENVWGLCGMSAPQIEIAEGMILFHDGWSCLMQPDSIRVLCQKAWDGDKYYDRIYLNDTSTIQKLLDVWASCKAD